MAVLVHLVRHGEVENPRALSYGRLPGFRLSEAGRAQALGAAQYLRSYGGDVVHMSTSPLERAIETAEIIATTLGLPPPMTDERLIEASSWRDGLPRALAPLTYVRRYFNATDRQKIESPVLVAERMFATIRDALGYLRNDGAAAVLVSHQAPISWAKVAVERGVEAIGHAFVANITPWVYVRGPCELASVTTLVYETPTSKPHIRYFSP
ncbi:MAG: histidine phosphatase family protein [Polyangiaceae bacterium]|nr:histidine phosphatase family protein [Polyangiaceae bacterium]